MRERAASASSHGSVQIGQTLPLLLLPMAAVVMMTICIAIIAAAAFGTFLHIHALEALVEILHAEGGCVVHVRQLVRIAQARPREIPEDMRLSEISTLLPPLPSVLALLAAGPPSSVLALR